MHKIAILASGSGTNAENIAKIFHRGSRIRVALTITNRKSAGVIARMEALNVPMKYVPNSVWDNDPEEVVRILRESGAELIVLAGFMHVLRPEIVKAFAGRIINIHPSLLPAYGGKGMWGHHVHEAVIAAGESKSGVTVHYVTEEVDGGEILMQEEVQITPDDNAETLEAKIHPVEYSLYPRAIVAAFNRIDEEEKPLKEEAAAAQFEEASDAAGNPEPPKKSVDEEWAGTLGIKYDPKAVPPPMPHTGAPVPPPIPGQQQAPFRPMHANKPQAPAQGVQQQQQQAPAMPSNYLLWSVLATIFCCTLAGIVAIVFSAQVSSKYFAGDYEGAERASNRAQIWIIVSFVLGVLTSTLYMPLMMISQ